MINDVLDNTISLFKANVKQAYVSLLFLIILYSFTLQLWVHYFTTQGVGFLSASSALVILAVLESILFLAALNIFAGKQAFESISCKSLFYFLFASGWVGAAALMGLVVLVIPGVFVIVTAILYAVLILLEDDGPLDAITNSLEMIRGHLVQVGFLMAVVFAAAGGVWLLLYGLAFLTGSLFNYAAFLASIASFTVWFFIAAFMISLYRQLKA